MARIRAVVFDVGGTLLYPADPVGETYASTRRKCGVKLSPEATETAFREAFRSCSPRAKGAVPRDGNDRAWWKQVVAKSTIDKAFPDPAAFETFFEDVYQFFAKPEAWGIYPEVLEVLRGSPRPRDRPLRPFQLGWPAQYRSRRQSSWRIPEQPFHQRRAGLGKARSRDLPSRRGKPAHQARVDPQRGRRRQERHRGPQARRLASHPDRAAQARPFGPPCVRITKR